ncbi:MAG: HEAT repeat domain-containing protein [Candidatus Kariarchaeaceae archaeon]|jgi:hypothetical protein
MSKKVFHRESLVPLLDIFLQVDDPSPLMTYITENSNLPGRRANLELAGAFIELVETTKSSLMAKIMVLCRKFLEYDNNLAPTNNPSEFLPFCAIWALGSIGARNEVYFDETTSLLRKLSNDPRWRIREAIAKGLQKLFQYQSAKTIETLGGWLNDSNWLEMRAIAAGMAEETARSQDREKSLHYLKIHRKILSFVLQADSYDSDEYKILKKGLSYTLSVIVSAIPKEGFAYCKELVKTDNKEVFSILKENLNKNRLKKKYSSEVLDILEKMQ